VTLAGFSEEEAARFFGPLVALPGPLRALLAPMAADEAKDLFLKRFSILLEAM